MHAICKTEVIQRKHPKSIRNKRKNIELYWLLFFYVLTAAYMLGCSYQHLQFAILPCLFLLATYWKFSD
jgi:hypothetical protein